MKKIVQRFTLSVLCILSACGVLQGSTQNVLAVSINNVRIEDSPYHYAWHVDKPINDYYERGWAKLSRFIVDGEVATCFDPTTEAFEGAGYESEPMLQNALVERVTKLAIANNVAEMSLEEYGAWQIYQHTIMFEDHGFQVDSTNIPNLTSYFLKFEETGHSFWTIPTFDFADKKVKTGTTRTFDVTNNVTNGWSVDSVSDFVEVKFGNGTLSVTNNNTKDENLSIRMTKNIPSTSKGLSMVFQKENSQQLGILKRNDPFSIELNLENTRNINVVLTKEDFETKQIAQGDGTLSGAQYTLYKSSGEKVASATTNSKGMLTFAELSTDFEYYIQETQASVGYSLNLEKISIDPLKLLEGQLLDAKLTHFVLSKEQIKTGFLELTKVKGEHKPGVQQHEAGAVFEVKLESDIKMNGYEKAKQYDLFETDANGYAKSKNLAYGTYRVTQIKSPSPDLALSPPFQFVVSQHNESKHYVVSNQQFHAFFTIVKKDSTSGKIITKSNATFQIWDKDQKKWYTQIVGNKEIDTFTTDESGSVTIPLSMASGNYELVELYAPDAYIVSSERIPFQITSTTAHETNDMGDALIVLEVSNERMVGSLEVSKVGEVLIAFDQIKQNFVYEERGLKDAVFELRAKSDILDPADGNVRFKQNETITTFQTNEDGQGGVQNLYFGEYTLQEIQAPNGFVLDTNVYDVVLSSNNLESNLVVHTQTITNQRQRYEVNVGKADENDETTLLGGAQFTMYAAKDIYNIDGDCIVSKGEIIQTLTTSQYEVSTFEVDLPQDRTGFSQKNANLMSDEQEPSQTIVNDPTSLFVVKETKAPYAYTTKNTSLYVDTTYVHPTLDVQKVNYLFLNAHKTATLDMTKRFEEHPIASLNNEHAYKQSRWEIHPMNQEGQQTNAPLYRFEVNKDGQAVVDSMDVISGQTIQEPLSMTLKDGRYKVIEVATDDSYQLDTTAYEFVVDHSVDEDQKVYVLNDRKPIYNHLKKFKVVVNKLDAQTKLPILNKNFRFEARLFDANDVLVSTVISNGQMLTGTSVFEFKGFIAKVEIRELQAPLDYQLSQEVKSFAIDSKTQDTLFDGNHTYTIDYVNQPYDTTVASGDESVGSLYTIVGIVSIFLGVVLIFRKRKFKQKNIN